MYPVATMCRLPGVSASGRDAWQVRAPSPCAESDGALLDRIREIHRISRGAYGAPRIHADLVDRGCTVGRKRVARLMRRAGLRGISRRKGTRTATRDARARAAPDLVERAFTADAPDRLWSADITYIPTRAGFLFLAVVLDAFSRRVVGWSMANHLRTRLVLDALDMALWQRRPDGVIHHSDQGSQYTSIAFGKRCRDAGVRPSTGSVGDCYDNAMCESFFATLECELLDRRRFRSHAEASMAVFEFIEGWCNPRRRHSAIGYLSPVNCERSKLPPRSPKSITVHENGATPIRLGSQAVCKANIRLTFQARVTRFHSPLTSLRPRRWNCRKPITDWMMPNTGSGVCLRRAWVYRPSGGPADAPSLARRSAPPVLAGLG